MLQKALKEEIQLCYKHSLNRDFEASIQKYCHFQVDHFKGNRRLVCTAAAQTHFLLPLGISF